MKITFFTPTLEVHGGTLVLKHYADFLAEHGHEVMVITPHKGNLQFNPKVNVLRFAKFPIRWVDFITFQMVYRPAFQYYAPESDIIIPIYTPLLIPAIRSGKGKVVYLAQDAPNIIWIGSFIRRLLRKKWVRKSLAGVVAVSRPMAEQYGKFLNREVMAIPNGIDHQIFFPGKRKKKSYILFVGRPNQPKGFLLFKAALAKVRAAFPEIEALVVTPTGEPDQENVHFVQQPTREDLAVLYNEALLYVSASYAESFGLPALEAMACGTACVLTDTLGSREYARDGENCLIVPVGDGTKLAENILELLKNPKQRAGLEKAGIETAKNYDWQKSAEAFKKYIENIK